jgi:hypothetical protein
MAITCTNNDVMDDPLSTKASAIRAEIIMIIYTIGRCFLTANWDRKIATGVDVVKFI